MQTAGLAFIRDVQISECTVRGDHRRCVQVLLNLLTNAAKYSRDGTQVTLRAREDKGLALIEIIDDGPGVSEQNIDRLFTPFDRLGPKKSKGIGGTGLGLALSKQLVESMGGEIGFRNRAQPEQGAIFWFTLNLAQAL